MYYASASADDGESVQQPDPQQASSSYVAQEQPQHFVVISNNNNCENNGGDDADQHVQPSASGSCNCASGYAMSCDSVNCINKYQRHDEIHLTHPPSQAQQQQQQQIVVNTTTSGEQIIAYGLPPPLPEQSHQQSQQGQQNFHEISQSIEQVSSAVIPARPNENVPTQVVDEKELRRQRLAEMARLRYQNLSKEEKKAVNSRRMLLRKRKRQREREMEELEAILRSSNDIEEDVVFIGELREKRQRENRARAARSRYHSMTPEERRAYNQKRRMRQLGLLNGESSVDPETVKAQIAQQNARKAELARQRYHRMSIDERKAYNKRRTESLRRRRMEEEALLATPAGQIDSDALQRAQQIMIRNAVRAEKARERYKRKAPEERERRRSRQSDGKLKSDHLEGDTIPSSSSHHSTRHRNNSGDILSAIEREVERRTLEARQILEQKARSGNDPNANLHVKQEQNLTIHHQPPLHPQQPEVINLCPVGPTIVHNNQIHAAPFATTQTIVHAAPASVAGGAVVMPADVKPATKYVSYMQLPGGTTQSGFLLADGQFVALQEPIQSYAIEQPPPGGFDNSFQHINPTPVLRTSGQPSVPGQPIIIGQRIELINAGDHPSYHPQHVAPGSNTIHVVNYGTGNIQQHPQAQIQHHHQQGPPPHHIITQHMPQHIQHQPPQQYTTIQQHNAHPPPQQIHMIPANASTSSGASVDPQIENKIQMQRAKRAERARRRYHEMSAEARHEFNAKRALALKMSRLKDEELCRLGDELDMTHREVDEELRRSIEQARIRRAKRAETARQKYQKMTPEQRKIHNAMRDAQRRQRKRELEEGGGVKPPS